MQNNDINTVLGLYNASKHLGWNIGKFAPYYHSGRTPPHTLVYGKPEWNKDDLTRWRDAGIIRKNAKLPTPTERTENV